jgi:hypothetical protein
VIIADGCAKAELHNNAEHMLCDIGTARIVAEIFREFFFVAFWSRKARLNRYPRHGESGSMTTLSSESRGLEQVTFVQPGQLV